MPHIDIMRGIIARFLRILGLFMPVIGIMRDINDKNSPLLGSFCLKGFEFVCKPSSVVYGHLSRLTVTDKLKRYSRYSVGRTALLTDTQSCSEWGLHGILCYHNIGELLPRLSILTVNGQLKKSTFKGIPLSHSRRYISVALSRRSPSPDVIRHPVLCCSDFPHNHC